MGAIIHKEIADGLRTIRNYIARFKYDGGTMLNSGETTRKFYKFIKDNNIPQPVFSWFGEAAYKPRTSGINTFATKLYSLFGLNDATQTIANSQPYISGNIAPNEKPCLKNNNGDSRYMTHPTISFAANEAWSVTFCVNFGGSNQTTNICGVKGGNSNINIKGSSNTITIVNESNAGAFGIGSKLIPYLGKFTKYTLVARGDGVISVYVNGLFSENINIASNFTFRDILAARVDYAYNCQLACLIIRAQALTPSQVATEANFLRSLYPEIPSVTIGSQVWATSNCEMVATPQGNLIANVTDNTAWSQSTATYNSVYAATSGTDEQKTYAAVKAAAMWCYYNNDVALGSTYGKLYNWYAVKLLQMDIDYYNAANPTTPWGWRVPTDTDFNTLATTLGGASVAGGKMKVAGTIYWNSPNTGADNSSGFSAIGGGSRQVNGSFSLLTFYCYMISLNLSGTNVILNYIRSTDASRNVYNLASPIEGYSLRLIKN